MPVDRWCCRAVVTLLALGSLSAQAAVIYVDASASGANNGSSWAAAFTSLQSALAIATSADEIWVAEGTYTPGSARNDAFVVPATQMYGGFAGTETLRNQRNILNHRTILSGEIGTLSPFDNSYHVIVVNEGVNAAWIDGFLITGGYAYGPYPDHVGGGVWAKGKFTLANCTIAGNEALFGGGAFVFGESPEASFVNCVFVGNSALDGGAASLQANATFINCTMTDNIVGKRGGAFGCDPLFAFTVSVVNSIIWGNNGFAGQIDDENNVVSVTYSIVEDGHPGTGNLTADPRLAAVGGWNVRLESGSPAIDAGNNAPLAPFEAIDADSAPRFVDDPATADTGAGTGAIVDIGALEYAPARLTVWKFGTAAGTITSTPAAIDCGETCSATLTAGAQVTLTATPGPGVEHNGWVGGGCPTFGTCTVTVPASVAARFGRVLHVRAGATGANDGTSWADAFTDLQSALTIAHPGDDVWVAAATYRPTSGTDRSISFRMVNGVGIYGGFLGNESQRDARDPRLNVTTLSGEIGAAGINDNTIHVVNGTTRSSNATIEGFRIVGGRADVDDGNGGTTGGGVFLFQSAAGVRRCVITGNSASVGGGGVNVQIGRPTLSELVIENNSAQIGGGLNMEQSKAVVRSSRIAFNVATSEGGGIRVGDGTPLIEDTAIEFNTGGYSGGGATSLFGEEVYRRCVFRGNTAQNGEAFSTANGAQVIIDSLFVGGFEYSIARFDSPVTLINDTFAGHAGRLVFIQGGSTLTNSIIWGNGAVQILESGGTVAVSHSIVKGGYSGTAISTADPKFVDAVTGDYSLRPDSPAIDSGTNTPVTSALDLASHARRVDAPLVGDTGTGAPPIVDRGAYEYQGIALTGPFPLDACAGSNATLSVSALGATPFTYQWRMNETPIVGATNSTLMLATVDEGDEASYDVIVTDTNGLSVTSSAAMLTVDSPVTAPTLTSFSPSTGMWRAVVSIVGANLLSVTDVRFNGRSAEGFTIENDGLIRAVVAPGTSTGSVTLHTACSTATGGVFTVAAFGPPPDLRVRATSTTSVLVTWTPVNDATEYLVERAIGNGTFEQAVSLQTGNASTFNENGRAADTVYRYRVRVFRPTEYSDYSNIDVATTVAFTDDSIAAGVTPVKADHWTQLRSAAGLMRTAAGLPAFTFTNGTLAGQPVRAVDVNELRTAVSQARTALGAYTVNYTNPTITTGMPISRVHLVELRDGVQ